MLEYCITYQFYTHIDPKSYTNVQPTCNGTAPRTFFNTTVLLFLILLWNLLLLRLLFFKIIIIILRAILNWIIYCWRLLIGIYRWLLIILIIILLLALFLWRILVILIFLSNKSSLVIHFKYNMEYIQ